MVNEKKNSRHFIQLKGNAYFWSIFKLKAVKSSKTGHSVQFSSVQIFHMLKLSKCIYITIRDTFKKMLFFKHQSPKCTYFFKMVLSTQIIDSCTIQILTAKLGQLQLKAGKINFCYMHLHSIKAIFQIKWF